MSPKLEALRSLEIRYKAVCRDFGGGCSEAARLLWLVQAEKSALTKEELKQYQDYMGVQHTAPVPEVPQEAEAERSI